ncbi:Zinc finger protein grt1 [Cytospora mali]|uniref:Zinc finger protein grt1 n=1 Tax=Cytospora mali TaxID=578113 RepID=A0A194V1S5_CYTMA|nr:Zinc finger protein grt1 [Valsa mali var. pyri (nom. inval.)]
MANNNENAFSRPPSQPTKKGGTRHSATQGASVPATSFTTSAFAPVEGFGDVAQGPSAVNDQQAQTGRFENANIAPVQTGHFGNINVAPVSSFHQATQSTNPATPNTQPAQKKSAVNKKSATAASGLQSSGNRPTRNKSIRNKSTGNTSSGSKPGVNEPIGNKTIGDKSGEDKAAGNKSADNKSGTNPSSSETPVRISQSCTPCRSRKTRCPRVEGKERCENCEKYDRDCIFEPTSKKVQGPGVRGKYNVKSKPKPKPQPQPQPAQGEAEIQDEVVVAAGPAPPGKKVRFSRNDKTTASKSSQKLNRKSIRTSNRKSTPSQTKASNRNKPTSKSPRTQKSVVPGDEQASFDFEMVSQNNTFGRPASNEAPASSSTRRSLFDMGSDEDELASKPLGSFAENVAPAGSFFAVDDPAAEDGGVNEPYEPPTSSTDEESDDFEYERILHNLIPKGSNYGPDESSYGPPINSAGDMLDEFEYQREVYDTSDSSPSYKGYPTADPVDEPYPTGDEEQQGRASRQTTAITQPEAAHENTEMDTAFRGATQTPLGTSQPTVQFSVFGPQTQIQPSQNSSAQSLPPGLAAQSSSAHSQSQAKPTTTQTTANFGDQIIEPPFRGRAPNQFSPCSDRLHDAFRKACLDTNTQSSASAMQRQAIAQSTFGQQSVYGQQPIFGLQSIAGQQFSQGAYNPANTSKNNQFLMHAQARDQSSFGQVQFAPTATPAVGSNRYLGRPTPAQTRPAPTVHPRIDIGNNMARAPNAPPSMPPYWNSFPQPATPAKADADAENDELSPLEPYFMLPPPLDDDPSSGLSSNLFMTTTSDYNTGPRGGSSSTAAFDDTTSFNAGTPAHHYSSAKLYFIMQKTRHDKANLPGGERLNLREMAELSDRVEAARVGALEKWKAANAGRESPYDTEGRLFLEWLDPLRVHKMRQLMKGSKNE